MNSVAEEIKSYYGSNSMNDDEYLEHYGMPRRSGRYPWGSGENPYQHGREQLEVYAALFCLEYRVKPSDIRIELRIYQNDDCDIWEPSPEDIEFVMNKIITLNKELERLDFEEA